MARQGVAVGRFARAGGSDDMGTGWVRAAAAAMSRTFGLGIGQSPVCAQLSTSKGDLPVGRTPDQLQAWEYPVRYAQDLRNRRQK